MNQIRSLYTSPNGLGRFDNDPPMRSDVLSVNTALLAGAKEGDGEDSVSYLEQMKRLGPSGLDEMIKQCLKDYGIHNLPENLRHHLFERLGSLLVIFIPRQLSSLSYIARLFGIPIGLPQSRLLGCTLDNMPQKEVEDILNNHREVSTRNFFGSDHERLGRELEFYCNPLYFEGNTGQDQAQVKMFLIVWDDPVILDEMQDKFSAIALKISRQLVTKGF